MTEALIVTGAEFIRLVRKYGRRRGIEVEFVPERGKGSHGTLYLGDRRATVKHRASELSSKLLHAMLKQLGLTMDDLQKG
jgi:mRNA interferase HicA